MEKMLDEGYHAPPIRLLEQMSFTFLATLLSKKVKVLYTFSKHYSEDCLLYLTA